MWHDTPHILLERYRRMIFAEKSRWEPSTGSAGSDLRHDHDDTKHSTTSDDMHDTRTCRLVALAVPDSGRAIGSQPLIGPRMRPEAAGGPPHQAPGRATQAALL